LLFGNSNLQKAVEDAAWEIDKNARNDAEIIKGISEFLQRNVKYDYKMRNISSHHDAYGALINKCAVCDGFAKAYKMIAEYLGFECLVVNGSKKDLSALLVGHAWNLIKYEGEFYHIDATWDTNIYEKIQTYSYSYLGLNDSEISNDHIWNILTTPKCNGNKLSYYGANRLIAYSEGQILDILIRCLKQKDKIIRLKVADGVVLPKNTRDYMGKKIELAIRNQNRFGAFAYNYMWLDEQRCLTVKIN